MSSVESESQNGRMTRRCQGWDYRQRAIYMITLVQRVRGRPLLGRLEVAEGTGGWIPLEAARASGLRPETVTARLQPTALGAAILAHWKRIGAFTPEIRPLYCQLMPDHLHALLEVTRPMARPLGNAIGGFKTGCEKIYRARATAAEDGSAAAGRLWAEGFQDSILFRDGQLGNMFDYLRDNPRRGAIKRLFPELFRVVRDLRVDLRLAPQARHEGACAVAEARASCRFFALGNRFLLDGPRVQVQVSRRDFRYQRAPKPGGGLKIVRDARGTPQIAFASPAFDAKCARLLAAAQVGTALVSPCISDGEREIARRALAAGLKLVTLSNKGFSPVAKPTGRSFDACADGRLLMLAPGAWPYTPGEKPLTREDALVLNRLAQALAGAGAAETNYAGATFEAVDACALRAVRGEYRPG